MGWVKFANLRTDKVLLVLHGLIMLCLPSPIEDERGETTSRDQRTHSIQTENFSYVRSFSVAGLTSNGEKHRRRPDEELYDLAKDPKQSINVVDDADYAADRIRLSDLLTKQLRESGDPKFKLDGHATYFMKGWTVHLNDQLWRDHPRKTKKMLSLLAAQLEQVSKVVPEKPLRQIQTVLIWINPTYDGVRPTAEFHPDARWLREHDRDPAMAKSVELTNTLNFEFENTRMPMLMLHELAHAYHNRVLGFRHPGIRAAFEAARESGRYAEVKRFTGRKIVNDKAYAMSNDREYFAESTEAYFGKNDFFPFTRDELKTHDPKMHDLLTELWGVELEADRIIESADQ